MKSLKVGACSAALVIALAVAGCGSSDDDSSGDDTSTDITKSEFVAQANEICKSSNAAIDAASKKVFTNGQPTPAETADFISATVVPQVETQISSIRGLGVPEGEEDQVNAILDEAESAVESVKEDPSAVVDSDPFAQANKLADEYGLTECAS